MSDAARAETQRLLQAARAEQATERRAPKGSPPPKAIDEQVACARRAARAAEWERAGRERRKSRRKLDARTRRIERASVEVDLAGLEHEWIETGNPICVALAAALLAGRADGLGIRRPAWVDAELAHWDAAIDGGEIVFPTAQDLERHRAWKRSVALATRVALTRALRGGSETAAEQLASDAEKRLAEELGPRGATSPAAIHRAVRQHRHRLDPAARRLASRLK